MRALLFRRLVVLSFFLIILLALSPCFGNQVTVNIEGFIEYPHCTQVGVTAKDTSSGTRPRMNIDCKSNGGGLRTLGAGEVDDRGNFKIKFLQDFILEDQAERGSCFLKLHGGPGAPCSGQKVQNVMVTIFKSIDNVKQTSAVIKEVKFSSVTCTSAIPSPYDKKTELLKNILPSPGKSFEYPHQPSVESFLSPKSGPVEAFPPNAKTFIRSLSKKKYSKSLSNLMSRKLLTFPVPFFKPIFPPLPVFRYPCPVLAPPAGKPKQSPATKKPVPPPTPVPTFNKSAPPLLPSPNAPPRPPNSPAPVTHPLPSPAHKSVPPPPSITNPTPPTEQPPSPPSPRAKSFSPFPKAPPIPKLPPNPTVPRRYFNSPKFGRQPPSPPS